MAKTDVSVYGLCTLRDLCREASDAKITIDMHKCNHVIRDDEKITELREKAFNALEEYSKALLAKFCEAGQTINKIVEGYKLDNMVKNIFGVET